LFDIQSTEVRVMRKADVVLDIIKNRGKCHDDLHAGRLDGRPPVGSA